MFAHLSFASNSADQSKDGQFIIADKSVSRKHLTIEVGIAGPDDCVSADHVKDIIYSDVLIKRNLKSRSKVILNDQNTKVGTTVNGEQIKGKDGHELNSDVNEIRIGRYEHLFR